MKKTAVLGVTACLAMGMMSGCGSSTTATTAAATEAAAETTAAAEETTAAEKADAESTAAEVKTPTGKFTVGFDQEFPPMGFVGDDGQYTGYDLDLAKAVADKLGLEFVAQPVNWDSKDMELESGNIDCIWNGFTMQGREDSYTWVGPYMANEQVFVVNADAGIAGTADLAGKAVEVQKDSSGLAALNEDENAELKASFGSVTEVADYNTALMDLESGACDAVCMDSIVAGYQITSSGKNFVILDDVLSKEEYGIGFKKGETELAEAVETALKELKEDGTVDEITEQWFGDASVFTLS